MRNKGKDVPLHPWLLDNGVYTILKEYCHELRKDRRLQDVYRYEIELGKQSQVDFGDLRS